MPMYFVQHGLALPKDVEPERSLSAEGRKEVESISAYLKRLGIAVGKIYHSGKKRAGETAQIFSRHIGDGSTYELSGMNPNDDVKEFAQTLEEDNAMYVGHLPHMEKLVSYLTAGDENTGVVKFANGGVVCIEKGAEGCHIEWCLKPFLSVVGLKA